MSNVSQLFFAPSEACIFQRFRAVLHEKDRLVSVNRQTNRAVRKYISFQPGNFFHASNCGAQPGAPCRRPAAQHIVRTALLPLYILFRSAEHGSVPQNSLPAARHQMTGTNSAGRKFSVLQSLMSRIARPDMAIRKPPTMDSSVIIVPEMKSPQSTVSP